MTRSKVQRTREPRRGGQVVAMMGVGLVVVLGFAGLAVDVGLATLACQECQDIADAGALAGAQEIRQPVSGLWTAWTTAWANVPSQESSVTTVGVNYYVPGQAIPDADPAPSGGALRVTATKFVKYNFLSALGFEGVTVKRQATAVAYQGGQCIMPIWISHTTPVQYGQPLNLFASGDTDTTVPGSFGFLMPAGGVDFRTAMAGLLTEDDEELQRVEDGDTVWANTGVAVDHWLAPLVKDADSRIKRSLAAPWTNDTFISFHADNPRILIVPMVEYVDGTGAGAHFTVKRLAAFWLENVVMNGANSYIQGVFIDFARPGGMVYGLKPTQLWH